MSQSLVADQVVSAANYWSNQAVASLESQSLVADQVVSASLVVGVTEGRGHGS